MVAKNLAIVCAFVICLTIAFEGHAACTTRVVVRKEVAVAAVVTPVFVATPIVATVTPLYSAGYDGNVTQQQLQALQQQIQSLSQSVQQLQQSIRSGQPLPPSPAAQPAKPGPQGAAPEAAKKELLGLVQARCASCHSEPVANAKGGKFVLTLADGSLRKLNATEIYKTLRRGKSAHENEPSMPLNGKELSDEEYSVLLGLLD